MATRIKQRPKLQYTNGYWRKRYKGEVHYLTTRYEVPNTPDDMDRLYLNVWLPMKARIDAGQEVSRKPMQSVMTAWGQGPDVEPASEPQSVATRAVDVPNGVGMASSLAGLPDELPETANGKVDTSLAHVLEEFLGEYRTAVEAGRKSAATWREYKDKLADFQSFAEHYKRSDVNEIDEHLLRHYQAHTASLPPFLKADGTEGRRISPTTAIKRLKAVKRFMEWAHTNRYLDELPRNVKKIHLVDGLQHNEPDPQVFTRKEVRELFGEAYRSGQEANVTNHRAALYVLLGLNCGYGQMDIATLRHEHIDWQKGIIDRGRNKTKRKTRSDQAHKLWPITLKLLKAEATDPKEHDLVLLTLRGSRPLVEESVDGTTAKTNPIGLALSKVRRSLVKKGKTHWSGPGKGIKYLRKTGAQWFEDNHPETRFDKRYLGQKVTDVVRHYRKVNNAPYFEALDAMGEHFGLESLI